MDLDRERLEFEREKHRDEVSVLRDRLALDSRQAGRYSTGAVTLIGAAIAVASAVLTTTIGGYFGLQSGAENNRTQLDIKLREVEGQIAVQTLIAEAERDRLEIEQKFEIIVQATKGLPPETAAENLLFFVKAGILDDPGNLIRGLAEQGEVPSLPAAGDTARNPLLERLAAAEAAPPTRAPVPRYFRITDGVVQGTDLYPVSHVESPNLGARTIEPRYIILHFTAGSGDGAIRALTQPGTRASTHLIVRRDGSVVQMIPLDLQAWHAGNSAWGNLRGLNSYSIGISFENWGALTPEGKHVFGGEVDAAERVRSADGRLWHEYTEVQIAVARELSRAVALAFPGVVDILPHSDISPGRKEDPGPVFPVAELRQAVFGRAEALPPPQ